MNKKQEQALITLGVALSVGAMVQAIVKQEASLLGLSSFDVALLGLAAGALVKRTV